MNATTRTGTVLVNHGSPASPDYRRHPVRQEVGAAALYCNAYALANDSWIALPDDLLDRVTWDSAD